MSSIQRSKTDSSTSPASSRFRRRNGRSERISPLTDLDGLLNESGPTPLAQCWQIFDEYYGQPSSSHYSEPSAQDRIKLSRGSTFASLLRATVEARRTAQGQIPSPAEASRTYLRLGLMREEYWKKTLWLLVIRAFRELQPGESSGTTGNETLESLMEVWKVFVATYAPYGETSDQTTGDAGSGWIGLPSAQKLKDVRNPSVTQLSKRFYPFFPRFAGMRHSSIPMAAAATFDLIVRRGKVTLQDPAVQEMRPFALFMANLLPYTEMPVVRLEHEFFSLDIDAGGVAEMIEWKDMTAKALAVFASNSGDEVSSAEVGTNRDIGIMYRNRLGRILSRRSDVGVQALWKEAIHFYDSADEDNKASTEERPAGFKGKPLPADLYNKFLHAFMVVKRPDLTTEVWTHMRSRGLEPTQATWNAMLDGTRYARDLTSLERIRGQMEAQGIRPDVGNWTALIAGYFACGRWEEALKAFEQMASTWAAAEAAAEAVAKQRRQSHPSQSEDPSTPTPALDIPADIVKPTTATLNAVVVGLLRLNRREQAAATLRRADELQIASDVLTYNTLLRTIVRDGRPREAAALLQDMQEHGIRPDIATFTILLDGVFRPTATGFDGSQPSASPISSPTSSSSSPPTETSSKTKPRHSPARDTAAASAASSPSSPSSSSFSAPTAEEQGQAQEEQEGEEDTEVTAKVLSILQAMEASGIPASSHSYSVLLDGLLKRHDNLPAAQAVLAHMTARGLRPTAHIYTILAGFHFARADLAAVQALWARIAHDEGAVDLIFFDRLVQGYAALGEVDAMLLFLARMVSRGFTPNWRLLTDVLAALVRANDWANARALVANAKDRSAGFLPPKQTSSQDRFWSLAADSGLLREYPS